MNIGLDWDGTVTSDPESFLAFVKLFRSAGHKVYITTMRYPSENADMTQEWLDSVDGVIFTSREAKINATLDAGVKINVWIDDNPRAIHESATEIFGDDVPEGHAIVVKYSMCGEEIHEEYLDKELNKKTE